MFDSIFKKIIAIFVIILIFSFSVTGMILYYTLGNFVTDEGKSELNYNVDLVIESVNSYMNNDVFSNDIRVKLLEQNLNAISLRTNSVVMVVNDKGQIFIMNKSDDLDIKNILSKLKYSKNSKGRLTNTKQYLDLVNGKIEKLEDDKDFYGLFKDEVVNTWVTVGKPIIGDDSGKRSIIGAAYISKPLPYVTKTRDEIIKLFVYAVLISTLLAIILFYAFSLKLTKPLKEMNKAVKVISKGDFRERLKIESNDEVGELAKNFNNMVTALNKLEEMRSGFIANVSHELRTPVTSIKGFVEGILDGTISKDRQDEYLKIVKEETIRLSRLVNNLLNLAKIESGGIILRPTIFDINELIRRTIIKFENLIVEKDLNISANFENEYVYVKADKDSIEQVIINLFHNAIKFTDINGEIKLNTVIKKNKVYISVQDTGIGIEEEELNRVWERFYKTDKSRSKDKKGAGLGLSIVKNIINENNGKIWVESEINKGSKFTFILEKANTVVK